MHKTSNKIHLNEKVYFEIIIISVELVSY